ncbi:DUF6966 domain-containing protein [Serratia microhaemolytica]|uniref:DUF6966 domain-containing protein n=1 Tax=Serratia microhaemolytica TaxID=2675110 RepID=UPI000FDE60CD|nr:hypothetical protein [Serratia microhaemolytica]
MKNTINDVIKQIIIILSRNDETAWVDVFHHALLQLDDDYEEALYNLRRLYAGMGSFNDLVLHKKGLLLIQENNDLDILRRKLHSLL